MRERNPRPPRPVRLGRRKMSTGRGKGKHSMLAKAYRTKCEMAGPWNVAARWPRPALRPKRSALRASQGFAPGAANEQAKPLTTGKALLAQAERTPKSREE